MVPKIYCNNLKTNIANLIIFEFVRPEIKFNFLFWSKKAWGVRED